MHLRTFFPVLALFLVHCSDDPAPAGAAGEGGAAGAGEAGSSGNAGAGAGGAGVAGAGGDAGASGSGEAGAGGSGAGGSGGSGQSGAAGAGAGGDAGAGGSSGNSGQSGSSGQAGEGGGSGAAGGPAGGAGGCSPYDDTAPCEPGFTCLSKSHDGSSGVCKKVGTKALGSSCPTQLVHTGCVEGLVCAEEPHGNHAHPTCRQICDPLAADPGCPANRICTAGYLLGGLTGACIVEHEDEEMVGLGEPCGSKVKSGSPCAPEAGKRYQGACVQESGGMVCRRLCALAGDGCDAEGVCQDMLSLGTLGVCQP